MLIIYAHPHKVGHNGYILKTIEQTLTQKNIDYTLIDLYEKKYNPVLTREELYTAGGDKKISSDTKKYQALFHTHKKFIFIYPTWWNGTPAILKGFFDRVLTSGFAFRYTHGIPRPLLKGKACVFTTTGGPSIYEKTIALNASLLNVTFFTLKFCGIKAKGYMIDKTTNLTEKNKLRIEKTVQKALKKFI